MSPYPLEQVNIAIVGPSWWVNYWHLPALQLHPQAKIVAVCGTKSRDQAETSAKYGKGVQAFTDYEKMMDEVKPHGVIVCTPNNLHCPVTLAALKRGIHVICEKPVSLNANEAASMVKAATEKSLICMVNFPYRSNPCVIKFRELIAQRWLGLPLHISGQYHGGFGLYRKPGWRGSTTQSGAGILGDLGSHLIDLARYISGDEFKAVTAHMMTTIWQKPDDPAPSLHSTEDPVTGDKNDDACAFLAEFHSGMQGVFHTSWVAYQGDAIQCQEIEIYGTHGRLRFRADHTGTILRGLQQDSKLWETIEVEGITHPDEKNSDEDIFRPGRHNEQNTTYKFVEAIRLGKPDEAPNMVEGLRSQEVIDAVLRASAERRWENV